MSVLFLEVMPNYFISSGLQSFEALDTYGRHYEDLQKLFPSRSDYKDKKG